MEFPFNPPCENLWAESVTIASGASAAEAVFTQGHALVGILMPAAWTAAQLGFNVSLDNVTYRTAYDNGGNFEQAKAEASAFLAIPTSDTLFAPYIQIKSVDTSNADVPQLADRTIILIFRRFLGGS